MSNFAGTYLQNRNLEKIRTDAYTDLQKSKMKSGEKIKTIFEALTQQNGGM